MKNEEKYFLKKLIADLKRKKLEECFELTKQYGIKLSSRNEEILGSIEDIKKFINPNIFEGEPNLFERGAVIDMLLEGMEDTNKNKIEKCLELFKSNGIIINDLGSYPNNIPYSFTWKKEYSIFNDLPQLVPTDTFEPLLMDYFYI